MPESAKVEILIDAFTEAAQEAVESVGDKLNGLSADAQPAQAAMNEVGDELDDTTSSAAVAQQAMDEAGSETRDLSVAMQALKSRADEAGDEVAQAGAKAGVTSGLFSRLTVSTNGLALSMRTLSTAATLSLIPSLLTLSTALLPLAGLFGAAAAAAGSLAVVFGGLAATGVVTHMQELKTAMKEARAEIVEIIQPLGEVFGPLLVDAVEALPTLVRRIVDSLGPLDQFAQTLRQLGRIAMDVIPAVTGVMFDLAQTALPVLIDVIQQLRETGPAVMNAVGEAVDRLGPLVMDLGAALGDLLPTLHQIGIVVAEMVLPALTSIVSVVDQAAEFVLSLGENLRRLAVAGAITAPAIFTIASSLGTLLGPLGLAASAVAAFAAAYRSNFMGIRDVVNSAISDVITRVQQFWTAHQDVFRRIQDLFTQYLAAVRDNLRAIQPHLQAIASNLTNLFGQALRELGSLAMDVIPAMTGVMFDLAQTALPILIDVIEELRAVGPGVMDAVGEAVDRLSGPLMALGGALGDLLPTLHEVGIITADLVLPALTSIVSVIDQVAEFVLSLDSGLRRLAVAGAITAPAIFSVASSLGTLLGPLGLAAAAVAAFAAAYKSNFMGIQDVVNGAVNDVIGRIRAFWTAHQDVFRRIQDTLQQYLAAVRDNLEAVRPALNAIAQNLMGLFSDALTLVGDILRGLVPIFEQVIDVLVRNRDHFQRLGRAILAGVNVAISALRDLLGVVRFVYMNFIIPLLDEVTDVWAMHFGTILDEAEETMAAIQDAIQPVLSAVASFWDQHGSTIVSITRTVFDVIVTLVGARLDALYTAIIVILNLIQGDWAEAFNAIEGLVDRTMDRVQTILEALGLAGIMQSQGSRMQSALQTYVIQPFNRVVQFFRRVTGVITRVFRAHLSRLRGLYQTHAGPLVQEFRETWNAIVNNIIRPAMNILTTVVRVGLNVLTTVIRTALNVIMALWNTFGDELLTVVEAAWNAISIVVTTALDALLTSVRVVLNLLQGDWGEAWDAIAAFVDRTLDRIVGFVETWGPQLWNAFIGVLNGVWNLTTDFWNGLANWMATPLGMLLTQFEIWGNKLRNILVSVWNAVVNVVAGATETLINNAISAINAFLSTLDDVADAISQIPHVNAPDVSQLEDVSVDTEGLTAEQRTINRQQARQENIAQVEATLTVEGESPLADFIRENVEAQTERQNRQDTRRTRRQTTR